MNKRKSIAQIGVYPPPYGGISVHIERLCEHLENSDIPFRIYDGNAVTSNKREHIVPITNIEKWSWKYLLQNNEDVIHNHFLRWQVRFSLSLLKLKGKKIVHTVHSLRSEGERLNKLHKGLIYLTGLLSDHFIAVSDEIKDKLIEFRIPAKKISVIPAFVPPAPSTVGALIPEQVRKFMAPDQRLIVANGGIGSIYNGVDLYGADLCVEMFTELIKQEPNIGFIYCITHIVDEKSLKSLQNKIDQAGLTHRFLFVHEKIPFYPLLSKADLFVRPTASDGDAISIREALYAAIPVVASDASLRPNGVRLFRNRDSADFTIQCREALCSPFQERATYRQEQEQFIHQVMDLLN